MNSSATWDLLTWLSISVVAFLVGGVTSSYPFATGSPGRRAGHFSRELGRAVGIRA